MATVAIDLQLSASLQKALEIAGAIAKENMHRSFAAPHLLKGLLHNDVQLEPMLVQADIDVYYLDEWADVRIEALPKSTSFSSGPSAAEDIPSLLEEADNVRLLLNADEVLPLHALVALSTPGVCFSYEQLKSFPLQRESLLQLAAARQQQQAWQSPSAANGKQTASAPPQQALMKYCTDKTLQASEGKLDPIIGREQEIRMMAEILSRRSKPNVLLIGEPGVGKSALAAGFALALVAKEVPGFLQEAKLFELDNGSLVAGASYKGETEERLKSVIKELKQFDKAILFIDEIHVLMDKQGAFSGTANLLKPELARGEITIIGATTTEEYRKYIERDEALARRFEVLQVEEPDPVTAFRMMKTVMPLYEAHHQVTVADDTLHEAIRLAKRYIKDSRLPDAAIDLADRSMAALKLVTDTGAEKLAALRLRYHELRGKQDASQEDYVWHFKQLKTSMSPIVWSEVAEGDPAEMKTTEEVIRFLDGAYEKLTTAVAVHRTTLEKHDVVSIVADKTGIPLGKVQAQEKERLLGMQELLAKRVVGQDHAIHVISESVLESRSGLGKPGQPVGSFFFLGPTGTGKTELAKALADFLFQDETSIIRFDMSEFKEEHSAALLYGAPPGYVGYEEGGLLVNKIRQQPYAVVLFDEIEKAHPSVFDLFLQIMDEGKLHDKLGKEGDFSNAVIIFTSNIGSKYVVDAFREGRIPDNISLMEIMSKHFRPEFLGRLTEIVPFAPMNEQMVGRILEIQLKELYTLLEKQGIKLELTDAAKTTLAKMGYTPEYGARPLSGVVRSQVRRPLSKKLISNELKEGNVVALESTADGQLSWSVR